MKIVGARGRIKSDILGSEYKIVIRCVDDRRSYTWIKSDQGYGHVCVWQNEHVV